MFSSETHDIIRGFASKISRRMQVDWDDLTQNTLVKVLAYGGEEPDNLKGWLWRVTSNEAVSMIRAEGRDYPAGHMNDEAVARVLNMDVSSDERGFDNVEAFAVARTVLDSVSETHRNVVVARAAGFTVGETASMLDLSPDMVKKYHYEVRQAASTTIE